MKLAVTSQGSELTSTADRRFGRAKCFLVVDTETDKTRMVDNSVNLKAAQGAGIEAGRKMAELGVEAVVTGNVGPKALGTFKAAGVRVYTGATGTVADAIEQWKAHKLALKPPKKESCHD